MTTEYYLYLPFSKRILHYYPYYALLIPSINKSGSHRWLSKKQVDAIWVVKDNLILFLDLCLGEFEKLFMYLSLYINPWSLLFFMGRNSRKSFGWYDWNEIHLPRAQHPSQWSTNWPGVRTLSCWETGI